MGNHRTRGDGGVRPAPPLAPVAISIEGAQPPVEALRVAERQEDAAVAVKDLGRATDAEVTTGRPAGSASTNDDTEGLWRDVRLAVDISAGEHVRTSAR